MRLALGKVSFHLAVMQSVNLFDCCFIDVLAVPLGPCW